MSTFLNKKLWILTLVLLLVFALLLVSSIELFAQNTMGDTNNDNQINVLDALLIAQVSVGINVENFNAQVADVNCSGTIDIVDALLVAQFYVGTISGFDCEITPTPLQVTPTPVTTSNVTSHPGIDSVSCAGYDIWNSNTVYSDAGTIVQYNGKLYRNSHFSFNQNPEETYVDEYSTWVLVGICSDSIVHGEGPWKACGQWDNWELANGFTIYNNIWGGDAAGTQCIWAYDESNWGVTADHPNTSGVKSYPNASWDFNTPVNSISNITSSFNVTVPNAGSYATTYDIWANSHAYEIMIWMNHHGDVGPIAGAWNDDGTPVPEATNVSVGGHTFNVYKGNIGFDVISFVRTTNTNSGTVNIKQIINYIQNQGWFGNVTLQEAQFGFEITSSAGGLDFTVNDYSIK